MLFRQIFDPHLAQYAYLIGCQRARQALVVDPERDVDQYIELAAAEGLRLTAVAETHIHADFLSGARELAERLGTKLYLSREGGADWQVEWARDSPYDVELLADGDTFTIGQIELRALHTPGHTPEHLSFMITDRGGGASEPMGLVSGDFVFVGDLGRPDLLESAAGQSGAMEPSARQLYRSAQRFLEFPDFLQVWPAHGAGSACGKALGAVPTSTVGYEKRFNVALDAVQRGESAFVNAILDGQPEPPLYFARMKKLNKEGPPLLGELPAPVRCSARDLVAASAGPQAVILDTRGDRRAFMRAHLPGSLPTPFDKSFPTLAGSYVEPSQQIYLLIDEPQVEAAVRDLVRIGLDHVVGWAPLAVLTEIVTDDLRTTEVIDFSELRRRLAVGAGVQVLDVRRAAELVSGRVPGSLNIAHTRLGARADELARERPVMVHCASGIRAAPATALLERRGYQASYVDDAFAHWHSEVAIDR